ncbi:MAG: MaoC family dehydratase [Acidimicrobiia bacterium]
MARTAGSVAEVMGLVGEEIGVSEWLEITQDRINTFADATDDHQWIHCDPDRAAAGPFGSTIAHGYLTLSLVIPMLEQVLTIENKTTSINYGLDKVRFTSPVPVGSKIRLKASLLDAKEVPSGVQVTLDCVIEIAGQERPACVATVVHRHLF